jgi:hypothetical protein
MAKSNKPIPAKTPAKTPIRIPSIEPILYSGIDNSVKTLKKSSSEKPQIIKSVHNIDTGISNVSFIGNRKEISVPKEEDMATKPFYGRKVAQRDESQKKPKKAKEKEKDTAEIPKIEKKTEKSNLKTKENEVRNDGKPTVKEFFTDHIKANGPSLKSDLKKLYISAHGKVSDQSIYVALKDARFKKEEDGRISVQEVPAAEVTPSVGSEVTPPVESAEQNS